ncbi:MAG: thiamine phosphate synthase [Chloroflexota bacterium]
MRLEVYVVTDGALSRGRSHEQVVTEAIEGGANVIQLREKHASSRELVELGRRLRDLTREAGVLFIVNDRVDVALAVDADGVHVGQDDIPADMVRRLIGPDKVLGVSAATREEARKAKADGADYLGVGAIYATSSKDDAGAPTGPALLKQIREAVDLPLVAIGGLNIHNAAEAIAYGADGVAVIAAVVSAPDIRQATRSLKAVVDEAKAKRRG